MNDWRINPTPVVNFNDEHLAVDYTPGVDQVLVDELAVDWGTDDPLQQPDPATGTLSILDFTLDWAARTDAARGVGVTTGLMGTPVRLAWVADANLASIPGEDSTWVFFRGRVTSLEVNQPEPVYTPDGARRWAVRIDIGLTSVETDLANRFAQSDTSWPAEYVDARVARIQALAQRPVTIRPYWLNATAKPMTADDLRDTSVRDLLLQLYNSSGADRMVYIPDTNEYQWLGRRRADVRTFAGMKTVAGTSASRAGLGAYMEPALMSPATGVDPTTVTPYLDGQFLQATNPVTKAAGQRITRASVTYQTPINSNPDDDMTLTKTFSDVTVSEQIIGEHAITLDSHHYAPDWATVNTQDLLALATQEGATWRPPRLRWDTRLTGGFETAAQLAVSLRGHAVGHTIWISRSWFATLGIRPVFSVTGGRIAYREGRWIIDYDLAGWSTTGGDVGSEVTVTKQHPITWDEFAGPDSSLVWGGDPGPRTIHESVTYEDLRFLGTGYGSAGAVGPDIGWDEYQ